VLPNPGKSFRTDRPKNLAAGEKIRPLIKKNAKMLLLIFQRFTMQNVRDKLSYINDNLQFCAENIAVLVQNQTKKKFSPFFGPFLINLPKIRPQMFQVPNNLV
jgi:hypothetical protein